MVADGGADAGRGRCRRRLVDLPVLAAVSGEHAERQHHPRLRLRLRRRPLLRRMFAADGRGPGAVGVRAEHRRDGARRGGLAALVLGMRWQLRTKAVAALSGPATLVLAGAAAIGFAGLGQDSSFPGILSVSIELAAVVALVAISAWQPEVHGRRVLRLVVVLWGTAAFGVSHVVAEYAIMIASAKPIGTPLPASDTSRSPPSPSAPC
jgi:hypothetical protein